MSFGKFRPFNITVLVFLLSGYFYLDVHGKPNIGNGAASSSNVKLLYNIKNGNIWQIDSEGDSKPRPVTNTTVATEKCHENITLPGNANIIDFNYVVGEDRVLWMSWNERLYSSPVLKEEVNVTNTETMVFWYDYYDYLQFSHRQIAVDHLNKKVYTIDKFLNPAVEVVDFAGRHRSVLFYFKTFKQIKDHVFEGKLPERLEEDPYVGMLYEQEYPISIVVDPYEGFMFIRTNFSWTSRIHRANLDGTSLKIIILDAGKIMHNDYKLDVDHLNKRIYWNDRDKGIIESADYNGNNRVKVTEVKDSSALAVYNNQLFWSQHKNEYVSSKNIKTCKLINHSCVPNHIRNIVLEGINDSADKIQAVGSVAEKNIFNPCSTNNGGCQHLCLLRHLDTSSSSSKSNLGHSCACNIGYKLSANLKNCEPILKYLVYESNNYLRSRTIKPPNENTTDNYLPHYVWGILEKNQVAEIDYNPLTNMLLYMECRNLVQIDLDGNMRGCWTITKSKTDCFKNLAYDWQAGKIYTTKLLAGNNTYVLEAVDVPPHFERQPYVHTEKIETIDKPLSLVVHPKTGYIYLLTFNALSNKLTVTRMDVGGQSSMQLHIIGSDNVTGLAVDNNKDRLYWFTDTGDIKYSNLDGRNTKTLSVKSPISQINSMIVDEEWVYLKNNRTIWRLNKDTGDQTSCIVPETQNTTLRSGMRIIQRFPEKLYYGEDYQITKAACKVFCTYNKEYKRSKKIADAEFCKCPTKTE